MTMRERIESIRPEAIWTHPEHDWRRFEGYEIVTTKQTIRIGIDNGQSCCETWGYLCSEDSPEKYVGWHLTRVERVVQLRDFKPRLVTQIIGDYGLDGGDAMFINVWTDRGMFQIAAYNSHNGYYGHSAVVVSRDLNVEVTL